MQATDLLARRHYASIIMLVGSRTDAITSDIMRSSESGNRARYDALRDLVRMGIITRGELVPYHNRYNAKVCRLTESGRRIYAALCELNATVGEVS